jgi:ankyrin repeat protein
MDEVGMDGDDFIDASREELDLIAAARASDRARIRISLKTIKKLQGTLDGTLGEEKLTLLCWAASEGHLSCVELLVEMGAQLDTADCNGYTGVSLAAMGGHAGCLARLIEAGADITKLDNRGKPPSFRAAMEGEQECLELLLEARALQSYEEKTAKFLKSKNFIKVIEVMELAVQERSKINGAEEEGGAGGGEATPTKKAQAVIAALGLSLALTYAKALRCMCRTLEAMALLTELSSSSADPSSTTSSTSFSAPSPFGKVHVVARAELRMLQQSERCRQEGNEAFASRDYDKAMRKYSEGLCIDSSNRQANALFHCNRAAAACALQRYAEAVNDCDRALEMRPSYEKALLRRARALVQLDRLSEAIRDFQAYVYSGSEEVTEAKLKEAREEMEMARAKQRLQRGKAEAEERERFDKDKYARRPPPEEGQSAGGEYSSSSSGHRFRPQQQPGAKTHKPHRPSGTQRQRNYRREMPSVSVKQPPTHYEVMGISKNSSGAEVKKAYHKLALKFHPDKNKKPGAEEKFKMVSAAYAVLSQVKERREYDLDNGINAPKTARF